MLHDKLIREQSLVEWTDKARQFHLFFRVAVWAGWIVFSVLLVRSLVWLMQMLR